MRRRIGASANTGKNIPARATRRACADNLKSLKEGATLWRKAVSGSPATRPVTLKREWQSANTWVCQGEEMSKIPQGEWSAIAVRHAQGESLSAIARSYGCTPPAIHYVLKRNGRQSVEKVEQPAPAPAASSGSSEPHPHLRLNGEIKLSTHPVIEPAARGNPEPAAPTNGPARPPGSGRRACAPLNRARRCAAPRRRAPGGPAARLKAWAFAKLRRNCR